MQLLRLRKSVVVTATNYDDVRTYFNIRFVRDLHTFEKFRFDRD